MNSHAQKPVIEPDIVPPLDVLILKEFHWNPQLSARTISKRLGAHESTVIDHLTRFWAIGLVTKTNEYVGRGSKARWVELFCGVPDKIQEYLSKK